MLIFINVNVEQIHPFSPIKCPYFVKSKMFMVVVYTNTAFNAVLCY